MTLTISAAQIQDLKAELACRAELNQLRQEAIDFYAPILEVFFNENKKIILADGSFSKEWKKYDSALHAGPCFRCYLGSGMNPNNRVTVHLSGDFQLSGDAGRSRGSVETFVVLANVRDGYITELCKVRDPEPIPTIEEVVGAIEKLAQLARDCEEPYRLISDLKCRPRIRYDFPRD
jgi:hypothetical protein